MYTSMSPFTTNSELNAFSSLLTGYSQTQNMFLPRLSFPHKPLASEQQEFSAGDTDEEQFDYSEDEENHAGFEPTLEDCNTAGGDDLKLNEEQSDDLTAATGSSTAPLKIIASLLSFHIYIICLTNW